jgi:hypothetical protein
MFAIVDWLIHLPIIFPLVFSACLGLEINSVQTVLLVLWLAIRLIP